MNSKQRKTLDKLFNDPTEKNILWRDIEKLILAVGGTMKQGNGSRIRILLCDESLNIHSPHPQKELKPHQVLAIRKTFLAGGIKP
jgi:hypothetical protein